MRLLTSYGLRCKRLGPFDFVAWPVLRIPATGAIDRPWKIGDVVNGWVWLFGCIPVTKHHLAVADVKQAERRLTSAESGGVLKAWNHIIEVTPVGGEHCR